MGLCEWFQTGNSITFDETFYLNAAKDVFHNGRFSGLDYGGVAHLPVVLAYGPAIARHGERVVNDPWAATDDYPKIIEIARWTHAVVVGIPLILVVVCWTFTRTGDAFSAGTAGLLAALSPTLIAQIFQAATDAAFALFFLLALAALGRYAVRPTNWRFGAAGGLIGLALAAKYGSVLLFPVAFVLGVIGEWRCGPVRPVGRRLVRLFTVHPLRVAGLVVVGVTVAWAVTGFQVYETPMGGKWVSDAFGSGPVGRLLSRVAAGAPMPSPIKGIMSQTLRARPSSDPAAMPTYLFGRPYPGGNRLYYAVAVPAKSTPVEIGLGLVVLARAGVALARRPRRQAGAERDGGDLGGPALVIGCALLLTACSLSAKQYGVRYALPVYPAVLILGVSSLTVLVPRRAVLRALLVALVVGQGASALSTGPRWISYCNSFAGGPARAVDMFATADADIGQGAYDLRDFLVERGEARAVCRLSGYTPPSAYGIEDVEWGIEPRCRYLAIGQGALLFNRTLAPLAGPLPRQLVGDTIYVFDLTNPDVLAAYREVHQLEHSAASR